MLDDKYIAKLITEGKQRVQERVIKDAILHIYYTYYQNDELTYEQALQGMVIYLYEEKYRLQNELRFEQQKKDWRL